MVLRHMTGALMVLLGHAISAVMLICSCDLDGGMVWLCWKADVFSSFIRCVQG